LKLKGLDKTSAAYHNSGMPKWSSKKTSRDINVLAASIVDQANGETIPYTSPEESTKNPAAVALWRLGGKKGGKARAKKLTPEQRKEIARKAAKGKVESLDKPWANKSQPRNVFKVPSVVGCQSTIVS